MLINSSTGSNSKIEDLIKKTLPDGQFRPNKAFYEKIGINSKRFGLILRGKQHPTIPEVKSIANYFQVDINELL